MCRIKKLFSLPRLAALFVLLALLVSAAYFGLILQQLNPLEEVKLDKFGQVGDFVGGIAGSLVTLASVFLFYDALRVQKDELSETRKELSDTRKEFEIARITNILYKQLEIFEAKVNTFEKLAHRAPVEGGLERLKHSMCEFRDIDKSIPLEYKQANYIKRTIRYIREEESQDLLVFFKNSTQLFFSLIDKSTITKQEKEHLIQIFYFNFRVAQLWPIYRGYKAIFELRALMKFASDAARNEEDQKNIQYDSMIHIQHADTVLKLLEENCAELWWADKPPPDALNSKKTKHHTTKNG